MQKAFTLLLLLLLSNMALADSNGGNSTPTPKDPYVEIKNNSQLGPRSQVEVVAVAAVSDSVISVTFIEQLGDVVVTLSDVSGELDYAVTHTANGSVLMMLPADASGEIAIVITDASGDQYIGLFTI